MSLLDELKQEIALAHTRQLRALMQNKPRLEATEGLAAHLISKGIKAGVRATLVEYGCEAKVFAQGMPPMIEAALDVTCVRWQPVAEDSCDGREVHTYTVRYSGEEVALVVVHTAHGGTSTQAADDPALPVAA